jgi:transketolase
MSSISLSELNELTKRVRKYILESTTTSGSGHPSSSLSATDLITVLLFGGYFETDLDQPDSSQNDRIIFSKGHASPLLYALYTLAGKISPDQLLTLRQFDSVLEGHPTMRFDYTEAATGSLGQGLGVGVGLALASKMGVANGFREFKTWVLMGDSEMAEGSVWEAMQLASHYNLNNLIGLIDVNRLGQRGETMYGYDVDNYANKCASFGWDSYIIDGHSLEQITETYQEILQDKESQSPKMIIAQTVKGKGVSFIENKAGWHGKALSQEELSKAILEIESSR